MMDDLFARKFRGAIHFVLIYVVTGLAVTFVTWTQKPLTLSDIFYITLLSPPIVPILFLALIGRGFGL